MAIALAVGLSVMAMAFAVGHISGAHFNPAVTCGLVAAGRFPVERAPVYIVAQVLGGAAAAGVFYLVLSGAPPAKWNTFTTISNLYGSGGFSMGVVFLTETVITALFLVVIVGATSRARARRVCADCDWSRVDDVSPGRHSDIERIPESGAFDSDRNLRRSSGARRPVAVLGRTDPGRRDRRRHLSLVAE